MVRLDPFSWEVLSSATVHFITMVTFRPDGTINRRLVDLLNPKVTATPINPPDGVISSDVIVDASRNLWFRLFVPIDSKNTRSSPLPVVIYFHGGGFGIGSPDMKIFDSFARRLARQLPAVVFSVNYRLSPEHRFPTQYHDGFDVIKFIDENVRNSSWVPHSEDRRRWFLAGDSAGGNIAHHVAVLCSGAPFREIKVKGVISIQPFFGGEERTESELRLRSNPVIPLEAADWFWKAFLPVGSDRDHPAANVFGPRVVEGFSGVEYPATLLVIGGLDLLQDWQRRFGEGLVRSGKVVQLVEYRNMKHGFYVTNPELAECEMMLNEARDFIERYS